MSMRYPRLILATIGGLALLLAACAPAAEPETTTAAPAATTTEATTTSTEMVLPAAPSTTEVTATTATVEDKGPVSVSGIPLDADAKAGGVLNVAESRNNRWLVWEQCCSGWAYAPLADTIVAYRTWGTVDDAAAGAFNEVVPALASTWEQSEDGMQLIFQLRDGVTFHDGSPLTCEDVAWSMETNRTGDQLNTSPRGAHISPVGQFSCTDATTLVVDMKRPKPSILQVIALSEFTILPKAVYDGNMDLARQGPAVGSGPFMAGEMIPGEKTVFVRNENYWDKPFPYMDGITATVISSSTAQISSLRAGRVDIRGDQRTANQDLMAKCEFCYAFPLISNTGQTYTLIPNMERHPWNMPEVRTALNLSIDRNRFHTLSGTAYSEPRGGLFLPGSGWEMPYERVKQIPGLDLERPRAEAVAEAVALLESVGFGPGELTFTHPGATSPNYVPDAIIMTEMVKEIGVNMILEEVERGVYYDTMQTGNFDVGGHKGYFRGTDPDGLFYEFYYPGSDRNYGRYSNPEAKRLIDLQSQTIDPEKRKQIAWDAAELILRDVVRTFTGFTADRTFFNNRVHGTMPGPVAMAGHWKQHKQTWLSE